MGKLSKIFGRDDDDSVEAPGSQSDEAPDAGAQQPEGDASHPPAAMPADAPAVQAPGDAPPAYDSIQEYEDSLPAPDIASSPPQ